MSDWKTRKLGEVLKLEYGKPLAKEHRDQEGIYPAYGANGVKCWSNQYYFDKPSIIVGRKGSAGEVNLTDKRFWPLDVTYFVTYDEAQYNLFFIFYCLKYLQLPRLAKGVKPGINRNDVYNIKLSFPSLLEQKRIVAILDEVFAGIDVAISNTEKNLTNARELFETYLNKSFTPKGNEWKYKTLKEISVKFSRGKSKHRPRGDKKLYGGNYPLIQTGDIGHSNHKITEYSQTYNELGLAQSELWPKGTICIAIVGANVAETAILDFDACFPDSVIGIVVATELADNNYIEYLLQSFKAELKAKGKGTARDNINLGTFANQRFPFPDVGTQKKIACRLEKLLCETQRLEFIYQQKLAALNKLKQSILQKAFTGELTTDILNQVTEPTEEVMAA